MSLVNGSGFDVVREAIIGMVYDLLGVVEVLVPNKLVNFGADGASEFQSSIIVVSKQLACDCTQLIFRVDYMTQKTSFAVFIQFNLPLVSRLDTHLRTMYQYFSHSSQKHMEF